MVVFANLRFSCKKKTDTDNYWMTKTDQFTKFHSAAIIVQFFLCEFRETNFFLHLFIAINSIGRVTCANNNSYISPDIVISAENHTTFCVTRCANFTELRLAAGALEASAVPVALHGVKKETVCDFAPTACTPLPGQRPRTHCWRLAAASGIHHCPCGTQKNYTHLEISQESVV